MTTVHPFVPSPTAHLENRQYPRDRHVGDIHRSRVGALHHSDRWR